MKATKKTLASLLAASLLLAECSAIHPSVTASAAGAVTATKSLTITAGKKKTIKVKGTYIKSKTFKSSKTKIATVNKKGVVTAKKAGNCIVTVTVKYRKAKKAKKLSTKKLICKVAVKKKNVNPAPIASPSTEPGTEPTAAPPANQTARTVETQQDLENALKETGLRSLTLQTNSAGKFTIPAGQYKDVELTVNAPNADIENNGVFQSVTIQAIKTDTWTEHAKGNIFTIIAVAAHIIVTKEADVPEITLPKTETRNKITITVEGTIGNVAIQTNASLVLDGSAASVPVSVESTAADAEVTAKVPVVVTTVTDIKVTLEKGAENSKVNTDASVSVSVKITNNTSASVEISKTDGTKVEEIPAGNEKDVSTTPVSPTPAPQATATPGSSPTSAPQATATPGSSSTITPVPTAAPVPTQTPASGRNEEDVAAITAIIKEQKALGATVSKSEAKRS